MDENVDKKLEEINFFSIKEIIVYRVQNFLQNSAFIF